MARQHLIAGRARTRWEGIQTDPYAGYQRRRAYAGGCPTSLSAAQAAMVAAGGTPPAYPEGYAGAQIDPECPPGTGNVNDKRYSCEAGMCAEEKPVCGCNVLGANTFALAPNGVAAGATINLAMDAGDACRWQPRSMLIVAYEADVANPERLAAPIVQVPTLLLNAAIGTIPMIRRIGANNFGIISDGYSDRKEITCVDWAPFTSVQNQGLTFTYLNIGANPVHIFNDMWGDNIG